ncbi:aldehyde dehydrogenase family protein [Rhodococcus opacus]|uniref:aldehyde dehydrogenase family protein n=1 Tax=Rhodococcus opacus TaxID=37919 RepID=UPI00211DF15E|nr:aldehyde dehydrogenase family protein [Rhodococcus opacus]
MTLTADDVAAMAQQITVGGKDFATESSFDVINPATGRVFTQAPAVTPDQLDEIFTTARSAFGSWRRDDDKRRQVLSNIADAIDNSADELAAILTAEQGKPLLDAHYELSYATRWLRYYADLEVKPQVIRDDAERFEEIIHKPLGVVSAITPWNFPINLAMWKVAPALRAGNTVVLKPSPYTPLATLALGRILRGVVPDGVLNIIAGPEPLGAAMVAHPIPRKVSFTGSTAVGRKVAVSAADDLKRVTLELGGNDPAILLDDVDVAAVAQSLFLGAFLNNGQVCGAVKRVYAHEAIKNDLVEALSEIARSVRVDDGFVDGAQFGPVNNEAQFNLVSSLVDDANRNGARITAGGHPLDRDGYFFPPTIIDNVNGDFRVVREEQFGPVLPIVSFTTEDDAVSQANDSKYALTASVWSSDPTRASKLAAEVDAGQVSINIHGGATEPHLPFGGQKWSGIGVENGPWGLESFTEMQVIAGPGRV